MRKVLFMILCVLIAFITTADAGELYSCVDRDGNRVLTNEPQDGMKCEARGKYKESKTQAVEGKEKEKEKVNAETDNTDLEVKKARAAYAEHINQCLACCGTKQQSCYNYLANNLFCDAEYANCKATCRSDGASPSAWGECW